MAGQNTIQAIVMGGSAGAIEALNTVLPALPRDFPIPVAVVLHVLPTKPSLLTNVLKPLCAMKVKEAEDKEPLMASTIYIAPPNYHLLIERQRTTSLSCDALVHYSRPSIDVLFESAADAYGSRLLGVLLSGANQDGVQGLAAITKRGGLSVVQSPETAAVDTMPQAALHAFDPTHVLPLSEIAPFLIRSATKPHDTAAFISRGNT